MRPPLKAARDYATKRLIEEYRIVFEQYEGEYLAEQGWAQETVSTTRWVAPKKATT